MLPPGLPDWLDGLEGWSSEDIRGLKSSNLFGSMGLNMMQNNACTIGLVRYRMSYRLRVSSLKEGG